MSILEPRLHNLLWSNIEIPDLISCWTWCGYIGKGEALFTEARPSLKTAQVAKIMYGLTRGELPKERVWRTCRNKLCVNPSHLVLEGSKELKVRFWSLVDKTPGLGIGDCWEWKGSTVYRGYGRFRISIKDGFVAAHRFALHLATGISLETEKLACHKCNNRKCCNPDHLYWGTAQENSNDCIRSNRQAAGSKNGSSKLTESQVLEIRAMVSTKKYTYNQVAAKYNVSRSCIAKLSQGRFWNHI